MYICHISEIRNYLHGNTSSHNQIPHLHCKEIVYVLDSVVWKLNTDMIRSGKHMLNSLFTLLLRTEQSFQFKSWMYKRFSRNFFYFYFFVIYSFIVPQPKCAPTVFSLDQKVFAFYLYSFMKKLFLSPFKITL